MCVTLVFIDECNTSYMVKFHIKGSKYAITCVVDSYLSKQGISTNCSCSCLITGICCINQTRCSCSCAKPSSRAHL